MEKNISIIREEQRERFNVLTEEISIINKEIEKRYKALPTSNKKEWEIMFLNMIMMVKWLALKIKIQTNY